MGFHIICILSSTEPRQECSQKSAPHRATAISFVNKLLCKSFNRFGIENNLNNHTYTTLYSRQRLVWRSSKSQNVFEKRFPSTLKDAPYYTQVKLIVQQVPPFGNEIDFCMREHFNTFSSQNRMAIGNTVLEISEFPRKKYLIVERLIF